MSFSFKIVLKGDTLLLDNVLKVVLGQRTKYEEWSAESRMSLILGEGLFLIGEGLCSFKLFLEEVCDPQESSGPRLERELVWMSRSEN